MRLKLFGLSLLFPLLRLAAQCGDVQQLSVSQQNQLQLFRPALDTALYYENLPAIDSITALVKTAYGAEGGKPETADSYTTLSSNTTWLPLLPALNLSRLLIAADSQAYVDSWKLCKGMYPPSYQPHSVPLRAGAETCIGLLRIANAETDLQRQNAYRQWARKGLDSLLTMQLPSGAFPFPDLRTYNDPVFTPIINSYLQLLGPDSVNVLVNGWIIDDSGTGEFKFDAGVIGVAFAEAFQFTGDTNYRNAARKVAAYLAPLHFNTNYNYNSFVAEGLALGHSITPGDTSWITRSAVNLRYAVLPGQLPNGRWADGHNARASYHSIIIHNTAVALLDLPAGNPWKDTLSQLLCAALRNFIAYDDQCGASTGYDGLLRSFMLDSSIVPVSLHDSLRNLIGRYINQSNSNGRYLDIYTMGLYLGQITNTAGTGPSLSSASTGISCLPNPFSSSVSIQYKLDQPAAVQLRITDSSGKEVYHSAEQQRPAGSFRIDWNAAGLAPGIYFVEVTGGAVLLTTKIVKAGE